MISPQWTPASLHRFSTAILAALQVSHKRAGLVEEGNLAAIYITAVGYCTWVGLHHTEYGERKVSCGNHLPLHCTAQLMMFVLQFGCCISFSLRKPNVGPYQRSHV